MKSRLELLNEMLAQDPNNAFARYGLAQEYANTGRLEDAVVEFQRLIESSPEYTAAYYHGGKTLERLDRGGEARLLYQRGIEACRRTGNAHALSEMQAALDELG